MFSIIPGLRAARLIGIASRKDASDRAAGLDVYGAALAILERPGVDLESPWCRATASVALWGFCRTARELGRYEGLVKTVRARRPRYLAWLEAPTGPEEREYLTWLEEIHAWSQVE